MYISKEARRKFHQNLRKWYLKNKRDFPWRYCNNPYKTLVSEVLLQKTKASKVVPVYIKFVKKYPTIKILQNAKIFDVKKILKSLGLIYRAERLISIAKNLFTYNHGKVPCQRDQLLNLKGLGEYVSFAVMCFAFNKKVPIVDNNIVRLFERIFGYVSSKKRPRDDASLWKLAESLLPKRNIENYNYALLDFGALQCTAKNPQHAKCPLRNICKYNIKNTIKN